MMRGMDENRKKYGGACTAIISLVILLVVYALSIGPAVTLIGATGTHRDPFWFTVFQCVYGPLALLPGPLGDLVEWWVETWDFYGEFH
jgi:hypothetical protein